MKKIFLLNIFVVLIICFISLNNTYAEPPDHAEDNWLGVYVTKIGFSANGLSQTLLQNYTTIQESDFDFVKTLSTPVWMYMDYNDTPTLHTENIGTITDIPAGSYYVYVYNDEQWSYNRGRWNQSDPFSCWGAMFFSLNGQASEVLGTNTLTISPNDLIKATIENNKTTTLSQTLTNIEIEVPPTTYTYTLSATASNPQ